MANIFYNLSNKILAPSNTYTKHILRRFKSKTKKKCQKKKNPFLFLRAQKEDYMPILDLMHKTFYKDEPTYSSLGIMPNACKDEYVLKVLTEGISIVCKCKYSGCVVGACINESTNPWEPDMTDKLACNMACPKMRSLYHFFAHLQRLPNLWECYKVPKIFEMTYLFTKQSDRKRGVAINLLRASRNLAADCGYKVGRVDATSYFTAKICEKLKMKLVAEVPYCSYIGENLDPIFKPPLPHKSARVYVDDALHEPR